MLIDGRKPSFDALAGLRHQVDILLRRHPGAKPGNPTPERIGDFMLRAREMAMFHLDCLLRAGTPHGQGVDTAMRDMDGLLVQVEPHVPGLRQSIRASLVGHLPRARQTQKAQAAARRPNIPKPEGWDELWKRAHEDVGYSRGRGSGMTMKQADLAVWKKCKSIKLGHVSLSAIRRWKWKKAKLALDTVQMVIDGLTKKFSSP